MEMLVGLVPLPVFIQHEAMMAHCALHPSGLLEVRNTGKSAKGWRN